MHSSHKNFIFFDYGDFLRTTANNVAEDSPEFEKIKFRRDIFESFTKGYLSSTKKFLTKLEIEMLPFAVALFPFMQATRFLTDYLNGDIYYKINYPNHNLIRTKNQIQFFKCILSEMEYIKNMTPGYGKKADTLPHYNSNKPARYALDLNAGLIEKLDIKIGDKLEIPQIFLYSDY